MRNGPRQLDTVWLATLTERGMLRPSFVPPAEIRQLRDYTRLRLDLIRDRTRYWQRLEKLLEDALIKMSAVASSLTTASARPSSRHSLAVSTTATPSWPGSTPRRRPAVTSGSSRHPGSTVTLAPAA